MRIVDMFVTPIAISDPPLLNAAGLHASYALRTIVELVTDDGVYGLGEMPGGESATRDLEAVRERVVGHDPFNLNSLWQSIEAHFDAQDDQVVTKKAMRTSILTRRAARTFSPIEVACLDIVGKAVGRPVCDLLGGRVREQVPFSGYLFFKHRGAGGALGFDTDPDATGWATAQQAAALTPEDIVTQAQEMCKAFGFNSLKLKGGVFAPDVEVQTISALRQAFGPGVPLRLDPNAIWSVPVAIRYGKAMEGVLEYYEDPVRGQAAMAEVARSVAIPLATNMCTTSFDDLPGSIRQDSESIILSDHHFWGGLRASMELARICRTFGRGLSMHSNSHVGISLMAMAHLAAATPNLTYACDTHYPWQREEVLIGGRIPFEDGCVVVGHEPGLGIELDRTALAACHECYVHCGLTERNDEIEMQKIDPNWTFKATRW